MSSPCVPDRRLNTRPGAAQQLRHRGCPRAFARQRAPRPSIRRSSRSPEHGRAILRRLQRQRPFASPKVHVELDDARHFLTTPNRSSTPSPRIRSIRGSRRCQPLHPRVLGTGKRHRNPRVVTGSCSSTTAHGAVKTRFATFFERSQRNNWGKNRAGTRLRRSAARAGGATRIDVDRWRGRLQSPEFARCAVAAQIGFDSAVALLSTYGGRGPSSGLGSRTPRSTATTICACNSCWNSA